MASLDDYYDTNDQINNYLHIQKENRLQLENFIYIFVNEDFKDVKILNKIFEILNQNIKFVDSMIIFQENTYLKIDITKKYAYDSFEYNFIKDSIAYTINYHLNNCDTNELLYLDLNKNPNKYDIQFNIFVTYSAKNQYFRYYMNDLFTSSNKVNFELIKGYYTKISSNLEYCNISKLKEIKTIKRKSSDLSLYVTKDHKKKDDSSSLKRKRILEEGEINEEEEKIQTKFRIKCNEKIFDIDDKIEFVKTFKQLDYIKIDYSLECYIDDSWIILSNTVKDILKNEY